MGRIKRYSNVTEDFEQSEWLERYYEYYDQPDFEKPQSASSAISLAENAVEDPQLAWICQQIRKWRRAVIHDFGCGACKLLAVLQKNSITKQMNFTYIGVDNDPDILEKAAIVASHLNLNEKCVFMLPERWESSGWLAHEKAIVVMNDVIHHMTHDQIGHLLSVVSSKILPNTPLIIGELALLKKVERQRISLANSDWEFLCKRLRLGVKTEPCFSPKGLPLVRVTVTVPKKSHSKITAFEFDSALKSTFENKLKSLDTSIELWTKKDSSEKVRVGMLEVRHHVGQLLAHWADQGKFLQLEAGVGMRLIKRENILAELASLISKKTVVIVEGDYGVGKTTILRTFLSKFSWPYLAATATLSADESTMGSWLIGEAKDRDYKDVLTVCRDFAKTPDVWFEDIIRDVAKLRILLVVDNCHLCRKKFVAHLQQACLVLKCKLLLVSSQALESIGPKTKRSKIVVHGFTHDETWVWLKKNVNSKYNKGQALEIWKECGNGNPQKLEIRFKANIEYSIPSSFGKLSSTDFTAICAAMLQPDGLRTSEIEKIAKVSVSTIQSLVERGLLQKRGAFLVPHDIVAGMVVGLRSFVEIMPTLGDMLCRLLTSKYPAKEIRDQRLSRDQCEDVLRLCNQFRLARRYQRAWQMLEAVSYSVYMDGDYERLLREIKTLLESSPRSYKPETNQALFWLWLRQGRIYKKRGLLDKAKSRFDLLLSNSSGRRHLAVVKELAEVARLQGDPELALKLFETARELDKRWAKDKRDRMITLKQIGITLCEKGDFELANELIEKSLRSRSNDDTYGIASCLRYLAYVKFSKTRSEEVTEETERLKLLNEAWEHAQSALDGFKSKHDAEGLSGTISLICKIGHYAITVKKYEQWRVPLKQVLQRYYLSCFREHRTNIRELACDMSLNIERDE